MFYFFIFTLGAGGDSLALLIERNYKQKSKLEKKTRHANIVFRIL